MVNKKETNLEGVKAMARTLLYTDINRTAYSPIPNPRSPNLPVALLPDRMQVSATVRVSIPEFWKRLKKDQEQSSLPTVKASVSKADE